jgi:hypothetical protein
MLFFLLFLLPCFVFSVSVTETTYMPSKEEYLPWFTGPLIAGSGKTCPKNHYVIQPALLIFSSSKFYNQHGNTSSIPCNQTIQPTLLYLFGITPWMDCQVAGSLITNFCRQQKDTRMSDTSLNFGFQLLQDQKSSWRPDLRVVLKQDFPTGHYQHLQLAKQGTDISGSGLYRIGLGANFQKLFYLEKTLLRSRFNITYKTSPTTSLEGLNVFGGGAGTSGHLDPLHYFSFDLAFEYLLSQNITFAIDLYYEGQSKGNFKGNAGKDMLGNQASVSSPSMRRFSLAPALEYNFSDAVGIIAGSWFTVYGKNTMQFASYVISLNYYH